MSRYCTSLFLVYTTKMINNVIISTMQDSIWLWMKILLPIIAKIKSFIHILIFWASPSGPIKTENSCFIICYRKDGIEGLPRRWKLEIFVVKHQWNHWINPFAPMNRIMQPKPLENNVCSPIKTDKDHAIWT